MMHFGFCWVLVRVGINVKDAGGKGNNIASQLADMMELVTSG